MIKIDHCYIAEISLSIWCTLRLKGLGLPSWLQSILFGFTFSHNLTLEGSKLRLKAKEFALEGTQQEIQQSLTSEYTGDVLRSLGSVLGYSSVLNVPRAPLKMMGVAAGSGAASAVARAGDSFASGVAHLTFDEEYIQRHQKVQQKKKHIGSLMQGFTEAISDIGEGLDGVADIIRKPVAGAREGGIGGFATGIGKGMVSAVVKPINAVGNVILDVGRGAGATLQRVAYKGKKIVEGRRPPRLLAGSLGAIVEYSALDALAARQFGRPIEVVVPLGVTMGPPIQAAASDDNASVSRSLLMLLILPDGLQVEWMDIPPVLLEDSDIGGDFAFLAALGAPPNAYDREGPSGHTKQGARRVWGCRFPLQDIGWEDGLEPGVNPKIALTAGAMSAGASATDFVLPVPWELGNSLAKVLYDVLATSRQPVRGDWTSTLRQELARIRQRAMQVDSVGQGVEKVVVWEVERVEVAIGNQSRWRTPYLPTESEQRLRWMDKGLLRRHPLLDPTVNASEASIPPVAMISMWAPAGDWKTVINQNTDAEGWQYGISWRTAAWHSRPRPLFDTVRRRKWIRHYRQRATLSTSRRGTHHFIDNSWLRGERHLSESWLRTCCKSICRCCCRRDRARRPSESASSNRGRSDQTPLLHDDGEMPSPCLLEEGRIE